MQILSTMFIILFLLATAVFHLLAGSQYVVGPATNLVCESEAAFGPTISVLECSRECDREAPCISFYFNVHDFSCNGSSHAHTDLTGCTFVDGTVYYTNIAGLNRRNQWVSSVVNFSSEYTSTSWCANQIIGSPDVYPAYGDNVLSWAPYDTDANQFIEVMFSTAVYITQVDVYETDHCGAVKKISARDASGQLHVLWETPEVTVIYEARIFAPPIPKTSFKSSIVRLDVDLTAADSWIEIDAIQLHGEL